jgi:hypothetical protein
LLTISELEVRNQILRTKFKGSEREAQEQINQLKRLINGEEELLERREK